MAHPLGGPTHRCQPKAQPPNPTTPRDLPEANGKLPDWAKDVAMRNQAQMEAENTVRGLYLEPLTAQITEQELELEEQEAELTEELAVQNPRAWASYDLRDELPEDREAFLDALEIWPDKPTTWLMVAGTRLMLADYHGLPRPTEPGNYN